MTLRIQCPSCERQFKVDSELMGRTVECGACEHQFKVTDDVLLSKGDRFYPGEVRKKGLERFARPETRGEMPVQFETAHYSGQASAADVTPNSPQQTVATALGVLVQVCFALILVFGTMTGALFEDMELIKRIVLAGFVVVMGASLIFYGAFHHKKEGVLTIFGLAALVMLLSVLLPVPKTLPPENTGPVAPRSEIEETPAETRLTPEELMEEIGFTPVIRAKARNPPESVIAIWAPLMEEQYKFQIQNFLQRKTKSAERPSFYNRPNGGLLVLEGISMGIPELEVLIERFGEVVDIYPDIQVMVIRVDGERLLEASPDLIRKLTDKEKPVFYIANKEELDHIDIERVSDAVQRLADAEPIRFKDEIGTRLIELLQEDGDDEFVAALGEALKVWTEPGGGAESAVAAVVHKRLAAGESVPRSLIQFLLLRKDPEAIVIAKMLWMSDPAAWEPFLVDAGAAAEEEVALEVGNSDRAIQQSAARILRTIGTSKCIPHIQAALEALKDDPDMANLLQAVIESIERNGA